MANERTVKAIAAELTKAYLMAHRTAPQSTIEVVAASIAETIPAITAENAHAVFVRAMQVEAIPTVPTLTDAAKNHMAESYPQTGATALEYKDQHAAWLPKTEIERAKNQRTALRNLCAALGDKEYQEFCRSHLSKKVGDHYEFVDKARATAFAVPKKALMRELYKRYWRNLPIAQGFPEGAMLHDGLIPPTVPEFREMLRMEAERAAAEF